VIVPSDLSFRENGTFLQSYDDDDGGGGDYDYNYNVLHAL
jgi:hypothetical protein